MLRNSRELVWVAIISTPMIIWGAILTSAYAPVTFGFGDNVLFHVAGQWLRAGDVYIKDFVHFRTPGAYYYYALFQSVFGANFHSTSMAILSETYIIQPFCSVVLAWSLSRSVFGYANWGIIIFSGAIFFFLIPIFQIRTGFPLISLALYVWSCRPNSHIAILCASGIVLGLSFWFGQETFLFAAVAIFISELSALRTGDSNFRVVALRLAIIGGSSLAVLSAIFAVYWFLGANVREMIYIFIWYAFVIQPSGMDLPYPSLQIGNLFYYLPIVALVSSVVVFILADKLNRTVVLLLSYTFLRYMSALGRSDVGHIGFASSEIALTLAFAVVSIDQIRFTSRLAAKALLLAGLLYAIFYLGIKQSSMAMILAGPALLFFMSAAQPNSSPQVSQIWRTGIAPLAAIAITFGLQMPYSQQFLRRSISRPIIDKSETVLGVRFSKTGNVEVRAVHRWMVSNRVKSVFAYPHYLLPYVFVSGHPTRYFYFEPEATAEENRDTVERLASNKPDAVVQDFGPMVAMSDRVLPIADFVSSHYHTVTFIRKIHTLELMMIRDHPTSIRRLVNRAFIKNSREDVSVTLETIPAAPSAVPSLLVTKSAKFEFGDEQQMKFVAALLSNGPSDASEAAVVVSRSGRESRTVLKANGLIAEIDVPPGTGPFTVQLEPGADGRPSRWFDPVAMKRSDTPDYLTVDFH